MTDSNFETLREFTTALDKKVEVGFEKVNTGFAEVKGQIQLIDQKIELKIESINSKVDSLRENSEKRFGYLEKLIYAMMAMIVPMFLLKVTILIKLFN